MNHPVARLPLVLLVLVALLPPAAVEGDHVAVVPFDSGTRVVREAAESLSGVGRSILESYPRGSEIFLGIVSLLPERARIKVIEWGMRLSLGHTPDRAADVSVDALAEWCVAQYSGTERYPAIILGSPNGAVAHLAALLGAPFLTTSFGLAFRHPTIEPDDLDAYRRTSVAVAADIIAANPTADFEVVCHYDPIHDRSMVQYVDFARIKLHDLPSCYRAFVHERLAPGGTLVLADCAYSWPQIRLDERVFLQIGGLGAIDPTEYLEMWEIEDRIDVREESEWGCPAPFAGAVVAYAAEGDLALVEIHRDHPIGFSLLAYEAYLICDGARSDLLLIDSFNHLNPRTNLEAGIPGFWLPFNTADGLERVESVLRTAALEIVYFAPLPSFARSPDTVPLDAWTELISPCATLEWIGVRPNKYPADPLAPYRFARDTASLRDASESRLHLRLSIEALSSLLSTPL